MSKTLQQIFLTNPTTTVADTDLYYLVQSPYTPGTDAAITGASLKAAFGAGGTINPGLINQLAYYASAGSTLSGLTTANNGVLITSGIGAPSISSTLPNAVQDNITRLGTIASIGAPLGGTFGGTGVNNGASTITIGGNITFSGAFTFTGTLTGNTSVTFPTSGTLATTSQLPTPSALTKVDDTNVTLTLGGTPATALLQAVSLTLGWTGQLGLTRGGTAASLTASNGGIVYSTASALAILAGTATANQVLLSGSSTTPAWSTATYPATTTINQILYSSAANVIGGISTVNGGVLVTNNTGVPSMLANPAATGRILQSANAAIPTWSTATFPSTAGTSGNVVISNGTNYISSTSLWPNTVGTSGKIVISDGTSNVYSTPTYPNASATSGKVIISDGTNFIASTSIFPNTVGSAGTILRSDGTVNAYTTTTYPNTNAINTIMYASSANVLGVIAAANSGVLVSSGTGVPSMLAAGTTGQLLQASTAGTPAWSTTTYPATNAINTLLYASSANVMAALATVNSAFLTTSSGGVPTWNTNQPFVRVNIQKFTASGTYTPTTGTKYAIMECIGNGAGGGGAASSSGAASGGGGGAGSYSRVVVTAATIGASQTVTIGATGTGGTAGNNAGTNGGDVSIGTLCVGKGGTGGGGAAANTSSTGGAGGVAGTGDVTAVGNAGTGGGGATITTASVPRGTGGASFLGGAPTGQQYIQSTGNAGNNYGAGGNGGYSFASGGNAAGGAGSTGIAIVTEFIFQ